MDIFSIILIAIGLAMDCFAVSIVYGVCSKKFICWETFLMAFLFGFFQAVMPLISFFQATLFSDIITQIDHWIALILLSFIGVKMILNSQKDKQESSSKEFRLGAVLLTSFSTSIDALVIGPIFVSYPEFIWKAVLIIGIVSFLFSFLGVYIGKYLNRFLRLNVEFAGGIILIGIGLKIFIEQTCF